MGVKNKSMKRLIAEDRTLTPPPLLGGEGTRDPRLRNGMGGPLPPGEGQGEGNVSN